MNKLTFWITDANRTEGTRLTATDNGNPTQAFLVPEHVNLGNFFEWLDEATPDFVWDAKANALEFVENHPEPDASWEDFLNADEGE